MAPRLPLHHPGRPRLEGRHVQRAGSRTASTGPAARWAGQRVQLRQGQRRLQHDLGVPGGPGYKYLVRMHFCDIASLALNEIYLNLYVNGHVAYQDLDLSEATDQVLASPYYLDLVVDVENAGLLSVVVGPSNSSDPSKVGGLLNGLEIMKINNTIGSLSAGVPALLAMRSSRTTGGGSGGAMARSLMCGFMFVALLGAAFMVMLRWKAETGREGGLAWSPLPLMFLMVDWGKGVSR
ncbi:putative receptor-like protein kinase [Iris pallida]|uniref:Receptor-like protein kinase n=1 Tax=Iris pallida TaxID=29817 RepID=A0AAX6EV28_IRIPA|nr:putative receptor-like protein kinase [Iris pallida]